jgi:hypothetical protein
MRHVKYGAYMKQASSRGTRGRCEGGRMRGRRGRSAAWAAGSGERAAGCAEGALWTLLCAAARHLATILEWHSQHRHGDITSRRRGCHGKRAVCSQPSDGSSRAAEIHGRSVIPVSAQSAKLLSSAAPRTRAGASTGRRCAATTGTQQGGRSSLMAAPPARPPPSGRPGKSCKSGPRRCGSTAQQLAYIILTSMTYCWYELCIAAG